MVSLERKVVRAAEARNQAAAVVEKRSEGSELAERIKGYKDANVLTGRETAHVADELQAVAFELIDDLYARIEELKDAREKAAAKSAGGKKK